MNNELLSLTLALGMIDNVTSYTNDCGISFETSDRTVYTSSGLFFKAIAEATGEEIHERDVNFTDIDGEPQTSHYYEISVKGWTLQTLNNPETATY